MYTNEKDFAEMVKKVTKLKGEGMSYTDAINSVTDDKYTKPKLLEYFMENDENFSEVAWANLGDGM